MIKKLRIKFILVSMLSLTLVLTVILGGVNIILHRRVVAYADTVLSVLDDNGGAFPQKNQPQREQYTAGLPTEPAYGKNGMRPNRNDFLWGNGNTMTVETPFESRYFSVKLDENGGVLETDTAQIASVDATLASDYAADAKEAGKSSGFLGDYRFKVSQTDYGSLIIFLDCSRSLSGFRTTLFSSLAVAVVGLLAVLLLLLASSKRIIKPVAESYEKQKRFITDAGHEIKTPLTIIGADTDLAEMELGENEWLSDIKRQTTRLTGLTDELIYLSRMEEEQIKLQYIDFPFSDVVGEMAQSFSAPAKTQGKELELNIQPMLSYTGDEKAIRKLISILLDNALKYSPEGDSITVTADKQGKSLRLNVSNTATQAVDADKLEHLFDRFYRTDGSRSSTSGGYGLGLSIAREIVTAHKGKIKAECPKGERLSINVTLPL